MFDKFFYHDYDLVNNNNNDGCDLDDMVTTNFWSQSLLCGDWVWIWILGSVALNSVNIKDQTNNNDDVGDNDGGENYIREYINIFNRKFIYFSFASLTKWNMK